jgi:hypothetical protein
MKKEISKKEQIIKYGEKYKLKSVEDAQFVIDLHDELKLKVNRLFRHALMQTKLFPEATRKAYRHRVKQNGIKSITFEKKIELIKKYLL